MIGIKFSVWKEETKRQQWVNVPSKMTPTLHTHCIFEVGGRCSLLLTSVTIEGNCYVEPSCASLRKLCAIV